VSLKKRVLSYDEVFEESLEMKYRL